MTEKRNKAVQNSHDENFIYHFKLVQIRVIIWLQLDYNNCADQFQLAQKQDLDGLKVLKYYNNYGVQKSFKQTNSMIVDNYTVLLYFNIFNQASILSLETDSIHHFIIVSYLNYSKSSFKQQKSYIRIQKLNWLRRITDIVKKIINTRAQNINPRFNMIFFELQFIREQKQLNGSQSSNSSNSNMALLMLSVGMRLKLAISLMKPKKYRVFEGIIMDIKDR
ncbi:UNKNOWN [Stylonychia lemnae]|uniref:Uncharacterized protein n=1 Tax=Stylonychia lemnae TaxID=5949 RepID=A0A078AM53_STYLE|nr:UNKNOWN [Stylonychia lemnae]|eukprot:CDW83460.1 UNKNOWN [Stylonychia lemnae]